MLRLAWPVVVGISVLGCKDKAAATSGATKSHTSTAATPGTSSPTLPGEVPRQRPPDPPALDINNAFEAEARDAAWANTAEQSIKAVAPHLTDVTCRHMQCRATVHAANEQEMMDATEKLGREDSLRGIDGAQAVILTQPEERGDKLAMTIYLRFNRD